VRRELGMFSRAHNRGADSELGIKSRIHTWSHVGEGGRGRRSNSLYFNEWRFPWRQLSGCQFRFVVVDC
jgi:hypothetical protein